MRAGAELLEAETGSLLLVDEESGELSSRSPRALRREDVDAGRVPAGRGIAGWVVENGQPLVVETPREDPRFYGGIDEASGFPRATSWPCRCGQGPRDRRRRGHQQAGRRLHRAGSASSRRRWPTRRPSRSTTRASTPARRRRRDLADVVPALRRRSARGETGLGVGDRGQRRARVGGQHPGARFDLADESAQHASRPELEEGGAAGRHQAAHAVDPAHGARDLREQRVMHLRARPDDRARGVRASGTAGSAQEIALMRSPSRPARAPSAPSGTPRPRGGASRAGLRPGPPARAAAPPPAPRRTPPPAWGC